MSFCSAPIPAIPVTWTGLLNSTLSSQVNAPFAPAGPVLQ